MRMGGEKQPLQRSLEGSVEHFLMMEETCVCMLRVRRGRFNIGGQRRVKGRPLEMGSRT